MNKGRVVIVSGPSGAGKTSVIKRLLDEGDLPLRLSVSATTRPPRPGEVDGVDYHFLSKDDFERRRENGEFLETFEVFGRGYLYGTQKSTVEAILRAGNSVLLEIDVNGMLQVVKHYPDATTIFVRPPSLEELERRLRARKTENDETIHARLEVAEQEWQFKDRYQHDIVNSDLDETVERLKQLLSN
ncbi:MAG: guanylate kinase [Planctomycetales bacterium]|nr:guanylate kinase [Planctomycetales bacterium]